jgi:transcriptional regulator with XRE-family HTH domain
MNKMKEIRMEKGFSQQEFAKLMGVSQNAISKYENGLTKLNEDGIIKASLILGVSCDELLDYHSAYMRFVDDLESLKKGR